MASRDGDRPKSLGLFWEDLIQRARSRGLSNADWYREANNIAGRPEKGFMSESTFYTWVAIGGQKGKRKGTNVWEWDKRLQLLVQAAVGTDEKDWKPWESRWKALRESGGGDEEAGQETSKESSSRNKWLGIAAAFLIFVAAVIGLVTKFVPDGDGASGDTGVGPTVATSYASSADTNFRCRGEDCKGKNPKDFKCDVGAEASFADTFDAEPYQGIVVQIKYSKTCRAIWAKMAGGKVGDTIEIYNDNGDVMSDKVLENDNKYTPMLPASTGTQVRACVTRGKSAPECTTYVPMPER